MSSINGDFPPPPSAHSFFYRSYRQLLRKANSQVISTLEAKLSKFINETRHPKIPGIKCGNCDGSQPDACAFAIYFHDPHIFGQTKLFCENITATEPHSFSHQDAHLGGCVQGSKSQGSPGCPVLGILNA
jgi:hypothetical protein